jgi:uncharacterized protein YqeY
MAMTRRRGTGDGSEGGRRMLRERFEETLRQAVLARDSRTASTLRLILAAVKDREIAERTRGNRNGLSEAQLLQLLQSMIRQRHESIRMYEQGGRPELAAEEAAEIAIVEQFLPKPLDDDALRLAIETAVVDAGAATLKDMGRVMALLGERHAGSIDLGKASALVRQRLSAG